MEPALQFLDKAREFTGSPCSSYAHYREGQVFRAMGDYQKALEVFAAVLLDPRNVDDRVVQAAEASAVECYGPIGAPEKATVFFQRIAPARYGALLERLADEYSRLGRADSAAALRAERHP